MYIIYSIIYIHINLYIYIHHIFYYIARVATFQESAQWVELTGYMKVER